ncbi:hypothetical protein [Actinomadura atramentaria]|uniref:hypothetical protein n=1 Tax=Actinomadura atramentaria TaxID=1990 RepID=UPI00036D2DA8|nr:hypothetical protein [Actinomadura atramentaria]
MYLVQLSTLELVRLEIALDYELSTYRAFETSAHTAQVIRELEAIQAKLKTAAFTSDRNQKIIDLMLAA